MGMEMVVVLATVVFFALLFALPFFFFLRIALRSSISLEPHQ
jgi:hypothetical protein